MIFLEDFLRLTGATMRFPGRAEQFPAFAQDSRQIAPGELFIAVRGEHYDGHAFLEEAVQSGAAGVVAEAKRFREREARQPGLASALEQAGAALLLVDDLRAALRAYARGILRQWHPRVIAVTGSVGKTTTKEAIATILGHSLLTFRTWRNYNDLLGVPLSLGRLQPEHRVAVLEFGCDHPGEIAALCEMTQPSIGVVTRVSHTQLQYFGSIERYAEELAALTRHLPPNGYAVLNALDPACLKMAAETRATPLLFSAQETDDPRTRVQCRFVQQKADDLVLTLAFPDQPQAGQGAETHYLHNLTGTHWAASVAAAIATTRVLGSSGEMAASLLEQFTPLPGRSRLLQGVAGSLLLDDTHNAPPIAVEAALETLRDLKHARASKRAVVVLGDMLRLGPYEEEAHRRIGRKVAEVADFLVTQGQRAEIIAQEARKAGMPAEAIEATYSAEDAAQVVRRYLEQTTPPLPVGKPAVHSAPAIILIKGAEEMRMERVTERLLARPEEAPEVLDRQTLAWKQVARMRPDRPTWVEVDLGAIAENCRRLKHLIGPDVELLASLKADAYGHGALRVARTVLHNGASRIGVATLSEAVPLRQAGIAAPILIFGYVPPWQMREAVRLGITVTIYSLEALEALSQAAQSLGLPAKAHLKIDSGMGRLGMRAEAPEPIRQIALRARNLPGVELEGIYTHFACADSTDQTHCRLQLARFNTVLADLETINARPPLVHASNSAATLALPEARFGMVRCGIALYGLDPSEEVRLPDGFRPALSFKTQIAQVKDVPAGECISYGCTFVTPRDMRIAAIPVGYADGFRRAPANWGEVLVHGQRVPLVGRVCMDQCMIDVSTLPDVAVGDEVVLIGQQGEERLTAEAVAARLGTISYEVVSEILARVPRMN
jgi:alanine racemase